jgi:hypothetical protein
MSSEIILKVNTKDFLMLQTIKKKDMDKLLMDIFKTGYMIYFPNKNKTLENQEYEGLRNSIIALREEIADSDLSEIGDIIISKINEKIEPLSDSLSKLLGLQTASAKKGELGENIIQHAFTTKYGDISYEDKSGVAHSGDAWIHLPDNKIIMIESKNYTSTIAKPEVEKMEFDMKHNNIRFSLFLSLNANIQGFRDMDFYTFNHNGEPYFAIMVSNLSNNMSKLDLAFNMIRKVIEMFNQPEKFPWIQKKIYEGLNKVNEITTKNYLLRDSFYVLEKSINSSLDSYHKTLRDYQYELEESIKLLIGNINSTMKESVEIKETIKDLMALHKSKKIYSVVSHIGDVFEKKKWEVKKNSENKYEIFNKGDKIGHFEIQLKKALIHFPLTQLELIFNAGNHLQNKQNLKILDTNF